MCADRSRGLGTKDLEAGREVAATALADNRPLATNDGIFDHVEGWRRTTISWSFERSALTTSQARAVGKR